RQDEEEAPGLDSRAGNLDEREGDDDGGVAEEERSAGEPHRPRSEERGGGDDRGDDERRRKDVLPLEDVGVLAEDARLHESDRRERAPQGAQARAWEIPEADRRIEEQLEPGLADPRVHVEILDDRERFVERPDAVEDAALERAGLERFDVRARGES